jgi:UTP--glucose-1-phosphate uridylyltransferase
VSDGRIVLRETAQTSKHDQAALADLDRHRFTSTNNLWFDLRAMAEALDARHGILGLPLIRNVKNVDPSDSSTPEVIQIETAMGAAIEVFEGARTIEVGRDRFVPVKTTNDLLVLRSDVYDVGSDYVLDPAAEVPFVDLDPDYYKTVPEFERRFPDGAPSLRRARSLTVSGDWTFGSRVTVVGDVKLQTHAAERVAPGSVVEHD